MFRVIIDLASFGLGILFAVLLNAAAWVITGEVPAWFAGLFAACVIAFAWVILTGEIEVAAFFAIYGAGLPSALLKSTSGPQLLSDIEALGSAAALIAAHIAVRVGIEMRGRSVHGSADG